jgi:hypothetical protein
MLKSRSNLTIECYRLFFSKIVEQCAMFSQKLLFEFSRIFAHKRLKTSETTFRSTDARIIFSKIIVFYIFDTHSFLIF